MLNEESMFFSLYGDLCRRRDKLEHKIQSIVSLLPVVLAIMIAINALLGFSAITLPISIVIVVMATTGAIVTWIYTHKFHDAKNASEVFKGLLFDASITSTQIRQPRGFSAPLRQAWIAIFLFYGVTGYLCASTAYKNAHRTAVAVSRMPDATILVG